MISEAIKAICELNERTQLERVECYRPGWAMFYSPRSKEIMSVRTSGPPLVSSCYTIDSLARACKDHDVIEVWVSPLCVAAIVSNECDSDRFVMLLRTSPQIQRLRQWESGSLVSQKQLYRDLSFTFSGDVETTGLLSSIRSVKWQALDGIESALGRKESIGRNIQNQIVEEEGAAIPQTFFLSVPYWDQFPDNKVRVQCYLDPEPSDKSFFVKPVPQSLESAQALSLERLAAAIDEATGDIPTFIGEPPSDATPT